MPSEEDEEKPKAKTDTNCERCAGTVKTEDAEQNVNLAHLLLFKADVTTAEACWEMEDGLEVREPRRVVVSVREYPYQLYNSP